MKARCPHGSPWYVECWPCADEVIDEHGTKVVPLFPFEIDLDRHDYVRCRDRIWPRGCGPKPEELYADCPFFSAEPIDFSHSYFARNPEPEPLTSSHWTRIVADIKRRLFGKHLRVVK